MKKVIPLNDLVRISKNDREGFFRYLVGAGHKPMFTPDVSPKEFLDPALWQSCVSQLSSNSPHIYHHILHVLNVKGGWELTLRIADIVDNVLELVVVDFVDYSDRLKTVKGKKAGKVKKVEEVKVKTTIPVKEEVPKKEPKKKVDTKKAVFKNVPIKDTVLM